MTVHEQAQFYSYLHLPNARPPGHFTVLPVVSGHSVPYGIPLVSKG